MTRKHLLSISVSILALTAAPAIAQDFYVGFGAASGNFVEADDWSGSNTGSMQAMSATLGAKFNMGTVFVGGEFEMGTVSSYESGYWGPDAGADTIQRVRAIIGTDMGALSVFGSLGTATLSGELNGFDALSATGMTYGIGVDYAVTDRYSLRFEAIRDELDYDVYSENYSWDGNSVRMGVLFNF